MAGTRGRSGRKKTPTAVKKARGTLRKDRAVDEVEPPGGELPPKPDDLHTFASDEWDRLTPLAVEIGLVTKVDWLLWRMLFEQLSTYRKMNDALAVSGLVYDGGKDRVAWAAYPEVAIAKDAGAAVLRLATQFGLTPSSRSGLEVKGLAESKPATGTGGIGGLLNG